LTRTQHAIRLAFSRSGLGHPSAKLQERLVTIKSMKERTFAEGSR
jgi:hypothetical protein